MAGYSVTEKPCYWLKMDGTGNIMLGVGSQTGAHFLSSIGTEVKKPQERQ